MASRTKSSRSRHSRRASSTFVLSAAALLLAASPIASAHSFPYVPTQILLPGVACADSTTACEGEDLAYIFRQTDSGGVQFYSLNYSSSISQDPTLESPTDGDLPFLDDKSDTTAFGAARTPNGTLLVYAGDCETGKSGVWSYSVLDGEWKKRGLSKKGSGNRAPNFLGATLAFSYDLAPDMDQPTIYTYGGMCSAPTENTTSWQSDANYTSSMLSVAPDNSYSADTDYTVSLASSDGPSTPIAGFTLTELTPSMTNKSGLVTQQASWVLLGGHSETAFVNISTAAIWNLPGQSWTYVDVQSPESNRKTDLAVKDETSENRRRATTEVDSRSGHTATLSEDGSSIIILGGWVGDVDTPADPQLVILEMSEAYSGWQWSIPKKQPDVSMYGHGAAVLPGNVMMVYGGWEMNSSSSSNSKRATSSVRFYNLTSMSWTSSYSNPDANSDSSDDDSAPKKNGQPNSKRLGLGLGLGFGLAVLIALALAAFCWFKKRKRRRESRDQAVRALSQDASHFLPDHDEMLEREDDPWGEGTWNGNGDPYQAGERSLGYESLRARPGAFVGPLPGLHIPRKPVTTRQSTRGYAPTAGFVSAPNQIHPIYEDDEEESFHQAVRFKDEVHTPTSDSPSDPFQTPIQGHVPPLFASGGRGSATPSPESPRRHDPEVQDWVSDVDAADALLARMNSRGPQGRISPVRHNSSRAAASRDDESRSGSNLSESARSAAESFKESARRTLIGPLLGAGVEHPKPGSSSSSSYNTARSSFGALRIEGPSLLLGNDNGAYFEDEPPAPPSPSKKKPRRGLFGSIRRAFSGGGNSAASSLEDMAQVRRSFDQEPYGGDYEPGLVGMHGELLRRKQGRRGWEPESENARYAVPATADRSPETDWDIERAVEQRLVQVMFTVPRERLRVVNGDADGSDRDDELPVQPQTAELVDPEKEGRRSIASIDEGYNEKAALMGDELRVKDDEKLDEKPDMEVLVDERLEREIEERLQEHDDKLQEEEKKELSPRAQEKQPEVGQQVQPEPQQQVQQEQQGQQQEQAPIQPPQPLHLHPIRPLFHRQSPPSPASSPSPPPAGSRVHSRSHSRTHSRSQSRQRGPHSRQLSTDTGKLSFAQHLDLPNLERGFSHETDDSMGRRSSGVLMEAQAMPLSRERPRTRVLAMVNSFESLSREGSPSPSPSPSRERH